MPDGDTPEEVQQNLRVLFSDLVPVTERVLKFFDQAITGYLVAAGADMISGDVPNERPGQAQGQDNS